MLRFRNKNVLFYCHYPDKLLSTQRQGFFKKVYRFFLDFAEEITTGAARCIVVNSNFTLKVFYDNFNILRKYCKHRPRVLYPSIQEKSFVKSKGFKVTIGELLGKEELDGKSNLRIITSLNRYERKKNIDLALKSFAYFKHKCEDLSAESVLVIAGGYDPRLPENVQHHQELVDLSVKLGITDNIVFLKSISND